jgi:hypothetical protein
MNEFNMVAEFNTASEEELNQVDGGERVTINPVKGDDGPGLRCPPPPRPILIHLH